MVILRIEHPVPDYADWKAAFDADPVDRRGMGVLRYRVMRPADDAGFILVDLEFETTGEAEAARSALERMWERVGVESPRALIVEVTEGVEL